MKKEKLKRNNISSTTIALVCCSLLSPVAVLAKDSKTATLKRPTAVSSSSRLPQQSLHAQSQQKQNATSQFDAVQAESEVATLTSAERQLLEQIKTNRQRTSNSTNNSQPASSVGSLNSDSELRLRLKEEIEGRQLLASQQEKLISEILRLKGKVRTLESQPSPEVNESFEKREGELLDQLKKERARASKLEQQVAESKESLTEQRIEKSREGRLLADLQAERSRGDKLRKEQTDLKVKLTQAEIAISKSEELKAVYKQTRNAAEQLELRLQAKGEVESDNQFLRNQLKQLEVAQEKYKKLALKQRDYSNELKVKNDAAEKHVEKLIRSSGQKQLELAAVNKSSMETAEQMRNLSQSNAALIAQVVELENTIAAKDKALAEVMHYGTDVEKLRTALKREEEKLVAAAQTKQELEQQIVMLSANVQLKSTESGAMQDQLDSSAKTLGVRDSEIVELRRQLSKVIEETRTLNQTIEDKNLQLAQLPELEKVVALGKRELELNKQDIKVCHSQLEQSQQLVAGMQEVRKQLVEAKNELLLKETARGMLGNEAVGLAKSSSENLAATQVASSTNAARTTILQQAGIDKNSQQSVPAATRSGVAGDVVIVEVRSSKINLRSGPGSEHSPMMQVQKGTRLTVEDRQGDWYRVFTPTGARAFVRADVVKIVDNGAVLPSATAARQGIVPELGSEQPEVLSSGTRNRGPSQPAARAGSNLSGEQVVPFGRVKIGGRSASRDIEDVAFDRLKKGFVNAK